MLINRAYKFRIYPDNNQKDIINKTFGCTRIYTKIKNARSYIIHDIIKIITDASLSEIVRHLEYKSKWIGKILYKVDAYILCIQICSKFGYQNKSAELKYKRI